MIKGISLHNFKSFDNIVLNLVDKGGRSMNHAFIYGENGCGKTNLIDSLMFLGRSTMTLLNERNRASPDDTITKFIDLLRTEKIDVRIRNEPMNVGELAKEYRMIDSEGTMGVAYRFEIDGHDATYRLEFDEDDVLISERLDYVISKNVGNLFEITRDEKRIQKNLVSGDYRRELNNLLNRYWGNHTFIGILMNESVMNNRSFFESELSDNIRSFLRYIGSMAIIKKDSRFVPNGRHIQLPSGFIKPSETGDLDSIQTILSKFFSRLYSDIKSVHFVREDAEDGRIRYSLYFDKRIAGKIRAIPAENESSGTKNLMAILPYLLMCADGRTVVIDEIDAGIHDLLVSQLISQCIPDITGQLIATTHNTSLMTYRDAPNIFIISIDRKGYKDIASIQSTEPPNVKTNVQKRYMEGYYSGIPLAADIGLMDILRTSMKEGR